MAGRIGMTGTQRGMTTSQRVMVKNVLHSHAAAGFRTVHHGDCIGADADFDTIARLLSLDVVLHPPSDDSKRAFREATASEVRPARSYIHRNHDIVDESDILFACPAGFKEELRSGTWATVRYARKHKLVILIFYPDGSVVRDGQR